MKRKLLLIIMMLCLVLTSSCGRAYGEESFFCMDTVATLRVDTDDNDVLSQCRDMMMELSAELSRQDENSLTAKYNASAEGCEISFDMAELIAISDSICRENGGAFNVFSGCLTVVWEECTVYPSDETVKKALGTVSPFSEYEDGFLKKSSPETMLEFGGIAKGYACDKAVAFLKEKGVRSGMVSFSSSIGVFGNNPDDKPWKIAVKDPFDTDGILGYISLSDGFLSVSGDYERWYEIEGRKYNHIIDVRSGVPVDNGVHSVTVIAPTGAESDGLSTAFFVLGAEAVAEKYSDSEEIKYLIVTDDGVYMNDSMKKIFVGQ